MRLQFAAKRCGRARYYLFQLDLEDERLRKGVPTKAYTVVSALAVTEELERLQGVDEKFRDTARRCIEKLQETHAGQSSTDAVVVAARARTCTLNVDKVKKKLGAKLLDNVRRRKTIERIVGRALFESPEKHPGLAQDFCQLGWDESRLRTCLGMFQWPAS